MSLQLISLISRISPKIINTFQRRSFCEMSKKALVFLAPGAEEMEAVIAIDVLRRGGVSYFLSRFTRPVPPKTGGRDRRGAPQLEHCRLQ
jgi:hypothetical protein